MIIPSCIFVSVITLAAILFVNRRRHDPESTNKEPGSADRRLSAAQLSVGKKELEIVFDTIPEEIFVLDKEFKIIRANKSCAAAIQQPVQYLIGRTCYNLFWGRETYCDECPARLCFEKRTPILKRPFIYRGEDKTHYYEISAYPVMNHMHNAYHVIEIRKNITDEKKMIEHMIRSEKLASIGKMTGGIAHEMNNPLSGISGNASNLLAKPDKYGLNERGIIRVTAIQNLATRAMAIMTDLLHLSQQPEQLFILTDINELLHKAVNSLHINGLQDVTQTFQCDHNLPLLYCDPVKIQQVVIHLTNNALQAIQEKRQIRVDNQTVKGSLVISTKHKEDQIIITFADNGIGIAEKYRTKIFDPFFSTKPTGQGTGLGLSVSNKIIEEHGGKILFECTNGLTIFTLLLPVQQGRFSQPLNK